MASRGHKLRRRYGHAHVLKWQARDGQAFALTQGGSLFTVTFDTHKRKWVAADSDQEFLGSAIRKRDAQKIAERVAEGVR